MALREFLHRHSKGYLFCCFENSSFRSNRTSSLYYGGGGIRGGPSTTIRNCTLTGNTASQGGGLFLSGGSVQNCTIYNNYASYGGGGGIWNYFGPTVTLESCIIYGNTAASGNPDIYGSVSIKNCDIGNSTGATITDLGGNLPIGT